jgi:hypothetical protein
MSIILFLSQNIELGLWYSMPLSTIFQLYSGSQFFLVEETGVPAENHRPTASHR